MIALAIPAAYLLGMLVAFGVQAHIYRGDFDRYMRVFRHSPHLLLALLFWPVLAVWEVVLRGPFRVAWSIGASAHRRAQERAARLASVPKPVLGDTRGSYRGES